MMVAFSKSSASSKVRSVLPTATVHCADLDTAATANITKRVHWQIVVDEIPINSVSCTYTTSGTTWTGSGAFKRDFPMDRYVLLVYCPLPPSVPTRPTARTRDIDVVVSLGLGGSSTPFSYPFTLKRTTVSPPSQVAICVAPVFGQVDLVQLLEWRLNHWLLGIETVHWYDRTDGLVLEDWVRRFSIVTGAKDTWGAGAPVSPDTYMTDLLEMSGKYGDQVRVPSSSQTSKSLTHGLCRSSTMPTVSVGLGPRIRQSGSPLSTSTKASSTLR